MSPRRITAIAAAAALAAAAGTTVPAEAQRRAPVVSQMVVFKSGKAVTKRVSTKGVRVRVGRKRCAVASRTALAVLVRSRIGRIGLRDFGTCSRRARDGAGLFVRAIRRDRNRGNNGWVYKVGRRAATAGAADPSGPFGTGRRLRRGQRIVWFYCVLSGTSCQRSLSIRTRAEPGALVVKVVGYDDEGRGELTSGATVRAGRASALTGADGRARLTLASGRYRVYAEKDGLVRSFSERVSVP
jgi:hypothetical protein